MALGIVVIGSLEGLRVCARNPLSVEVLRVLVDFLDEVEPADLSVPAPPFAYHGPSPFAHGLRCVARIARATNSAHLGTMASASMSQIRRV